MEKGNSPNMITLVAGSRVSELSTTSRGTTRFFKAFLVEKCLKVDNDQLESREKSIGSPENSSGTRLGAYGNAISQPGP